MIKGIIHQKNIIIININTPKVWALKCIKKLLSHRKEEPQSNALIVGGFITSFQQWLDHPEMQQHDKL